ncbi:hypothetical protein SLS53_006633 [Cytospora paraplurivora]|uniref:FAD-binding PCMH-type domain-containing protein n=1 Tax=Cytospora paraplurivora TaxID=2898453 RepID=A0AAN9U2W5_9PEZI
MASLTFLSELSESLSSDSRVIADHDSPEFASSMERWSNYGLKVPSAIIQPASEQDIVLVVQALLKASIPFVPASGGHSPFSTIDQGGVVLELNRYKGVEVDASKNRATIKGGTLMKELQVALHPHTQFAAVGNGTTVGVIPYYIGGGISAYTPFIGHGAENIISAKLVTAKGELVEVSETQNPELLWGVRGAGQFLGLVTEVTIKTSPYTLLGNDQGQRMCGTYVFPSQQADAVLAALRPIMENNKYVSAGHLLIAMAPPNFKHQALIAAPQVFCSAEEATKLFQPLADLGPIMQTLVPSTFENHSDHLAYMCAKGDFKRFTQDGLIGWNAENFRQLIELHAEIVSNCPDAALTSYTLEWHSPSKAHREKDTSFGLEDVTYWLNLASWYKDATNHDLVDSADKKAQAIMRRGTEEQDFISYTNTSRADPISYRYKGAKRIERLKALKKQ